MKPRVPTLAWDFITEQEGDELKAYWDGPKPVGGSVGGWAISRGIHAPDVNQFSVWTQEKSNMRFGLLLHEIADGICPHIEPDLSDPQLSACMSLAYNLANGIEEFNGSTLLKLLNEGKPGEAADQFLRWCHMRDSSGAEIVDEDLLARRKKERELFLSGTLGPALPEVPKTIDKTAPLDNPSVRVRLDLAVGGIMKKWIPAIIGGLGLLASWIDPVIAKAIGHWVADNPSWGTLVGGLVAAIYHALPSPVQKKR